MAEKLIVIVGPTASGKSALAIKLAKKLKGEVVSADSRQVYRGLNLGTGKVTIKEMAGVPHYLLDVASPAKVFTVTDYQKLAIKAIGSIISRGKTPILAGGTGFYIDSITKGIVVPEVKANNKLRQKLAKKSVTELFTILKKLDPARAKNIDSKNPHRLIRAIEIASALGKVPKLKPTKITYRMLKIGLKPDDNILKKNIATRLQERLKKGMITEVKKLHENGLSWKRLTNLGLEYNFITQYLQKKITKEEMIDQLNTASWQYAKRQMTWFKRDKEIHWVKRDTETNRLIKEFLN